jgi:divalent metal cation (Fe/Co/Zn/Cd) transporter
MAHNNSPSRTSLIKKAMILVWIGELWNVAEAAIALSVGAQVGSIALIAFGLKSIIELFLGGILIWQLRKEWHVADGHQISEKGALKYLGIAFFVLALYISGQSLATLFGWLQEPEPSGTGIILVLASAALMTSLYFGKTSIAKKIGSRSLQKEAVATLACDLQDMTVLIGLGFNALLGWWWADPVAALLLVPFLIKEGREALDESREVDANNAII